MLCLQLPAISPLSRYISSHYSNEINPFSSLKLCTIAGKRTGEGPNLECFSPPFPTAKFRLAASVSAVDVEIDDEKTTIQLPGELRAELKPKHIAVILDGNGRWAKRRGLPIHHGHKAGIGNMNQLILSCCKFGIEALTVFAFSTENWNRSKVEVDHLMRLIEDFVLIDVKELIERNGIRFSVIGNKSRLPESLQSAIFSAEKSSKANKGMHFVSAISYSGRFDITEATKKIASRVQRGILRVEDIDEALVGEHLSTNLIDLPDPDLLIRTSGEMRVSNFLLWQLAYGEFCFPDKFFPDFGEDDLIEALASFQQRQRRFGERKN